MEALTLDQLIELLGTDQIPGSENERAILCVRISELVAMNGEKWVRQNRKRLLEEWTVVVTGGFIKRLG
jgi:hypothetical protein